MVPVLLLRPYGVMREMREWLLAGVLTVCVGSFVGCATPQPAAPPQLRVTNGYYIEKTPPHRHPHHKPPGTKTVSRPAVPPADATAARIADASRAVSRGSTTRIATVRCNQFIHRTAPAIDTARSDFGYGAELVDPGEREANSL